LPTNLFLALRFGEPDEDPPIPHADLAKPSGSDSLGVGEALDADADVGGRRRHKDSRRRRTSKGSRRRRKFKSKFIRRRRKFKRKFIRKALSTPPMLASCKKSWTFQIPGTAKTVLRACVQCKPDAPLPFMIGKHGKRLIWACDANKFKKKAFCKKSLSWLDPNKKAYQPASETGNTSEQTCGSLRGLVSRNNEAAKLYSKHSQDLKLSTTAKLTSASLYTSSRTNYAFKQKSNKLEEMGLTTVQVEKAFHVANKRTPSFVTTQVFTVLSHTVRACGYIPEQPLQCLDTKQSECVWSYVKSYVGKFKSGRKLPGKVSSNKQHQDQPCGPNSLLALSTSRKL